jgi:Family of unknown function (DUF6064)
MAMAVTGNNELLELFTRYNEGLWPVHLVGYAAGVAAVALLFARRRDRADRVIAGLLAALWLWLGVVFQGLYATDVDVVLGTAYAVMFVLQAYLLFRHGVLRGELTFRPRAGLTGAVGWAALVYAVIVYPVIGAVLGHGWPESPLLGMAPCPTTILTFGLLLLATPPVPRRLLVVPFAWAVLAPPAAMARGVYEDAGLLIAGILTVTLVLVRERRRRGGPVSADVPSINTPELHDDESRVLT